jgi:hypothetical protein
MDYKYKNEEEITKESPLISWIENDFLFNYLNKEEFGQ